MCSGLAAFFVATLGILLTPESSAQTSKMGPPSASQRRVDKVHRNVETKTHATDGANSVFLPAVGYKTGGMEAAFVTVADVNGDGKSDLLTTNTYFSNTVAVLLGHGDGTFGSPSTFDSGAGFPPGCSVDIDGDGNLDGCVQ
jgi:hypothetical protein